MIIGASNKIRTSHSVVFRIHATSVLSTLYAILTRGGVLQAIRASDHHVSGEYLSSVDGRTWQAE